MRRKLCPDCKEPLDKNCQGEITCTSCNPCLCCSDGPGYGAEDTDEDTVSPTEG